MLTGQRPGEVMGMATGELHQLDDAACRLLGVPGGRMKASQVHIVPLAAAVREIVMTELTRATMVGICVHRSASLQGCTEILCRLLRAVIDGLDDEAPNGGSALKADRPTPHDLRSIRYQRHVAGSEYHVTTGWLCAAHSYGDVHSVYDRYDRFTEKRIALSAGKAICARSSRASRGRCRDHRVASGVM